MDDVTAQTETVNQPGEGNTEAVGPAEQKPTEQTPEVQPEGEQTVTPQRGDPSVALKQERELRRQLQREIAEIKGQQRMQEMPQGDDAQEVYNHPAFQELAVKAAEYELKEGTQEILEQFPHLPKEVVSAIKRNPRGFVNPTTTNVPQALMDIQEYVEGIAGDYPAQPTGQPKPFPVAGSNQVTGTGSKQNADIQKILAKPFEDWTPQEEQAVESYRNSMR